VLQDVGDAGGIGWRGAESRSKDFILVIVDDRKKLGSRADVTVQPGGGIQFGKRLFALKFKSMGRRHFNPAFRRHSLMRIMSDAMAAMQD
jgi:hypothetical protein